MSLVEPFTKIPPPQDDEDDDYDESDGDSDLPKENSDKRDSKASSPSTVSAEEPFGLLMDEDEDESSIADQRLFQGMIEEAIEEEEVLSSSDPSSSSSPSSSSPSLDTPGSHPEAGTTSPPVERPLSLPQLSLQVLETLSPHSTTSSGRTLDLSPAKKRDVDSSRRVKATDAFLLQDDWRDKKSRRSKDKEKDKEKEKDKSEKEKEKEKDKSEKKGVFRRIKSNKKESIIPPDAVSTLKDNKREAKDREKELKRQEKELKREEKEKSKYRNSSMPSSPIAQHVLSSREGQRLSPLTRNLSSEDAFSLHQMSFSSSSSSSPSSPPLSKSPMSFSRTKKDPKLEQYAIFDDVLPSNAKSLKLTRSLSFHNLRSLEKLLLFHTDLSLSSSMSCYGGRFLALHLRRSLSPSSSSSSPPHSSPTSLSSSSPLSLSSSSSASSSSSSPSLPSDFLLQKLNLLPSPEILNWYRKTTTLHKVSHKLHHSWAAPTRLMRERPLILLPTHVDDLDPPSLSKPEVQSASSLDPKAKQIRRNTMSRLTPSKTPIQILLKEKENEKKSRRQSFRSTLIQNPGSAMIFKLQPLQEGYLLFKQTRWKRRWVILDTNNIYLFKSTEDLKPPSLTINLHCAAVKRAIKHDQPSFEILTAQACHSFLYDKENPEKGVELETWISSIQKVCDNLVISSIGGTSGPSKENLLTKTFSTLINENDIEAAKNSREATEEPQGTILRIAVTTGNRACADCGSKEPEWASTNFGVFICIECSGIHRSFGTHISKVRSVKLDKWEFEQIQTMKQIGNLKSNEEWEFQVPEKYEPLRINEHSKLDERKRWLTWKYVEGRFRKDWEERKKQFESADLQEDLLSFTHQKHHPNHSQPQHFLQLQQQFQQQQHSQNLQVRSYNSIIPYSKREEFKSMLLQLLREDLDFREEVRNLILGPNKPTATSKSPSSLSPTTSTSTSTPESLAVNRSASAPSSCAASPSSSSPPMTPPFQRRSPAQESSPEAV